MEITKKSFAGLVVAASLFLSMTQVALAQRPRAIDLSFLEDDRGANRGAATPFLHAAAFSGMKGVDNSPVLSNGIQTPTLEMAFVAPNMVGARNLKMVPANESLQVPASMSLPVVFNDRAFDIQIGRAPISGKIQAPVSESAVTSSAFRSASLDRYLKELSRIRTQADTAPTKAELDAMYDKLSGLGTLFVRPMAGNSQSQLNPSELRLTSVRRTNRLRAMMAAITGLSVLSVAPKLLASPAEHHRAMLAALQGSPMPLNFFDGIVQAINRHPAFESPAVTGLVIVLFLLTVSAWRAPGHWSGISRRTTTFVKGVLLPLLIAAEFFYALPFPTMAIFGGLAVALMGYGLGYRIRGALKKREGSFSRSGGTSIFIFCEAFFYGLSLVLIFAPLYLRILVKFFWGDIPVGLASVSPIIQVGAILLSFFAFKFNSLINDRNPMIEWFSKLSTAKWVLNFQPVGWFWNLPAVKRFFDSPTAKRFFNSLW